MREDRLVVLDYSENFADNFSTIAYGKILEKNLNLKCCYENKPLNRIKIEKFISYFNTDINFVPINRIEEISKKAYFFNNLFFDKKHIYKKMTKNNVIIQKHFNLNDISLIDENIKNDFKFNNIDFIKNYDILDKITSTGSIGLYLSKLDEINDDTKKFIYKATKKLNKYIKRPKLFIFSRNKNLNLNSFVDFEIIDLFDWKEEYYFLSNCKHKIVPNLKYSYSANFWAAVTNQKDYFYVACENKNKKVMMPFNWLNTLT